MTEYFLHVSVHIEILHNYKNEMTYDVYKMYNSEFYVVFALVRVKVGYIKGYFGNYVITNFNVIMCKSQDILLLDNYPHRTSIQCLHHKYYHNIRRSICRLGQIQIGQKNNCWVSFLLG